MTITESAPGTDLRTGRIVGIAGPVVDVEFPPGHLPEINTELDFTVTVDGETIYDKSQEGGDTPHLNRVKELKAIVRERLSAVAVAADD